VDEEVLGSKDSPRLLVVANDGGTLHVHLKLCDKPEKASEPVGDYHHATDETYQDPKDHDLVIGDQLLHRSTDLGNFEDLGQL
jgi:hypothetical protein